MSGPVSTAKPDRHPAISYEDVLARETRPVPNYLHEGRQVQASDNTVAASRYYDPHFFELEARHVWSRTWQMACREEDIPKIGDYHIYDVLGKSLLVVRTSATKIKALYNSCLHRGRKLATLNGCKKEFKCPFHGFTWNRDGSFKENPIGWDFPDIKPEEFSLPEAKVALWGGFVFVNFDLNAKPLLDYITPLATDFERFDFPNRTRFAWIQKKMRCNWKVASEAFMEAHHSVTTHPQILPTISDANSQYDVPNDWVSRQFSATAVPSPFIPPMTEQAIFDTFNSGFGMGDAQPLPEGVTARAYLADMSRAALKAETGEDYASATDAEMLDPILYNVFPNMCFWGGYSSNIVYRWRPNGLDPDSCIMDIMIHRPAAKDKPREPAPAFELGLDDAFSKASHIVGEGLCAVFDQDMGNLPYVQEGLRASGTGLVRFGRYSEMRIRHMHSMIDRYIAEGAAPSTT
jgi:phenylpropionate dioxygenase-like ring-hydroxylating dioxygenase large terminal subunit